MSMRLFKPNVVFLLTRFGCRCFFSWKGSWNITGQGEYIPKEGPAIIVSNHTSYVDPPLLGSAIRRPVSYMAKAELFDRPLYRWFYRKLEAYPVKQDSFDRAALVATLEKLKNNGLVGIFPEGHRSEDGELMEFEQGLGLIAIKSRAPIIPCGVAGAFQMMKPHTSGVRKSHLELHFGPPVDVSDLYGSADQRQAYAEVARRAHSAVARLATQAQESRDAWIRQKEGQVTGNPS